MAVGSRPLRSWVIATRGVESPLTTATATIVIQHSEAERFMGREIVQLRVRLDMLVNRHVHAISLVTRCAW